MKEKITYSVEFFGTASKKWIASGDARARNNDQPFTLAQAKKHAKALNKSNGMSYRVLATVVPPPPTKTVAIYQSSPKG